MEPTAGYTFTPSRGPVLYVSDNANSDSHSEPSFLMSHIS